MTFKLILKIKVESIENGERFCERNVLLLLTLISYLRTRKHLQRLNLAGLVECNKNGVQTDVIQPNAHLFLLLNQKREKKNTRIIQSFNNLSTSLVAYVRLKLQIHNTDIEASHKHETQKFVAEFPWCLWLNSAPLDCHSCRVSQHVEASFRAKNI